MANYNTLKTSVANVIKENGNNEITGKLLQQALIAMINALGAGYQFMGVAQPSTNPGAPDQRVFYVAAQPGTYPKFNAEVTPGEIAFFYYSTTWLKDSITAVDLTEMGFKGTFQSGIGLDPSDGEPIIDVTYDASDYIPVGLGYKIIYSGGETDGNRAAIVGYNGDKYMASVLLAGGSDWKNKIVEISVPYIKYVRVSSCNPNHENYATPFAFNVVATTDVPAIVDENVKDIENILEQLSYIQPVIDVIRAGYIYMGVARPNDNFPEDATSTFYWIETPGTYPGGALATGEVGLLVWDGSDWTIEKLNIATKTALAATNEALGTLSDTVSDITSVVVKIISVVAAGYEFIGEITPASLFPADQYQYKVMFLAQTPGSYNNHGRFAIADDEIALLCYDPASEEWSKIALDVVKKSGPNTALLVGSAMGIMGNTPQAALYTHRAVTAGAGSGAAQVRLLRGRSIVWNQLIRSDNINFSFVYTGGDNAALIGNPFAMVAGHRYLILTLNTQNLLETRLRDPRSGLATGWVTDRVFIYDSDSNLNTSTSVQVMGAEVGVVTGYLNVIDLTKTFGSAAAAMTVEQFETLYLGIHGYNAGAIKNLTATGIKTTGFNQWDEQWELGGYSPSTGQKSDLMNTIRSANYIEVFADVYYYMKVPAGARVFFYDAQKNFIESGLYGNQELKIPANCRFITFHIGGITTYNHDSCINLSNPARNGQYEPHWSATTSWPITTMTGKAGGTGDSVVIYPDGMMSAGIAYDYGRVDADGWMRKVVAAVGKRVYQAGDESDASLITDGTNTNYPLTTPIEYTLDTPIYMGYAMAKSGTETMLPDQTGLSEPTSAPIDYDVVYPIDAAGNLVTALNAMLTANSLSGSFAEDGNGGVTYES